MSYSFDGTNKVISISSQTTMSVRDVWSRYLEWVATGDNSKYLPAFRTVGGDVIDGAEGTSIPIYHYLINGWKIKPMEANHTLKLITFISYYVVNIRTKFRSSKFYAKGFPRRIFWVCLPPI